MTKYQPIKYEENDVCHFWAEVGRSGCNFSLLFFKTMHKAKDSDNVRP